MNGAAFQILNKGSFTGKIFLRKCLYDNFFISYSAPQNLHGRLALTSKCRRYRMLTSWLSCGLQGMDRVKGSIAFTES